MRRMITRLALGLTFMLALMASPLAVHSAEASEVAGIKVPCWVAGLAGCTAKKVFDKDCTASVAVDDPKSGIGNVIDPGPDKWVKGDPFADNPKTSVYDQYGYGGLTWPKYACGAGKISPVDVAIDSPGLSFSNMGMSLLTLFMAIGSRIISIAYNPGIFHPLDPVLRVGAGIIGGTLFQALFWVTLGVTGIGIVWKAAKASVREAATNAGWIVSVLLIATACVAYPLVVAPKIDNTVTSGLGYLNQQMAGISGGTGATASDSVNSNLHHSILYQTWCSGMVGRSEGKTAEKFCPKFFAAGTLSRDEIDQVYAAKDRTGELNRIVGQHEDDYQKLSDELRTYNPTAYSYLTGKHNDARMSYTAFAWVGWLCSAPFVVIAALLVIMALLLVRFGIIVFPAIAVLGGHPKYRHHITNLYDFLAGAFVNAAVFGVLASVLILIIGALMGPTMTGTSDFFTSILLMFVATFLAWKFSKPYRHFKDMVPSLGKKRKASEPLPPLSDEPVSWRRSPKGGKRFTPDPDVDWSTTVPAEAQPSKFGAAMKGAKQGATASVVAGVVTGGAVTAGAVALGAAKGVAGSVIASKTADATGAAETRTAGALPAGSGPLTPSRVFMPGEQTHAVNPVHLEPLIASDGERIYAPYVPPIKVDNL